MLKLVFNEFSGKGEGDSVNGRGGGREGGCPGGGWVRRFRCGWVGKATPVGIVVNHRAVSDERQRHILHLKSSK